VADKSTVFVVDDDPGARQSLCWLIQQAGLPVRGFSSAREFLEWHASQQAEGGCLVLDVRMPDINGLQLQQCLWEQGIGLPIIFITAHGDVPSCAQALKAGALEFLEKPVDHEILLHHIFRALAINAEHRRQAEFAARVSQLTGSEKGVLDMLVAGKSLKQIAAVKNVTVQTIWKHYQSILQKVRVENDLELVRVATQWSGQRRT
jgi:two-component system, LuxR family, response regulator FixJ